MERGICPIVVRYFAVTRFCFNIWKLCWSTKVQIYHIYGHVTSSVTWP